MQERKDESTELRVEIRKLQVAAKFQRHRMILGSVAFNFLNACLQRVFTRAKFFKTKAIKNLSSFEEIEAYPKTPQESANWEDFKNRFWDDDSIDEILDKWRGARLSDAHPTRLMEGDSEPPTPAQLQAIVGECYKSRNEKEVRKSMDALIDKLDTVTRELGRAILE